MEKENNVENIEEKVEQVKTDEYQVETKTSAGVGKKIFSIALIVLCAVIVIGVTLGSYVTKSFNPGLNDPTYIVIHSSSNSSVNNSTYGQNSEEYKKLLSLYKDSFETTVFGALFQGNAFEGVTEKEGHVNLSSLTGTYLEFNYSDSQVIKINGKTLKEAGITPMVSNTNYRSAVIEVINSESFTQINVYFKYSDSGINNYSYIRFLTFAKQASLYEYIQSL